jgi:LysR family cys regulon transcriptional activator
MNFQQLRIIRETLRQDFNLTEVANALYTSQPGVSKHIKDLEDELGIEIFVRRGKRLLGLTEPGKELAEVVEPHPARYPEPAPHRRPVREPGNRPFRRRHHPHTGALRAAADHQVVQDRLSQRPPRAAPGQPGRDRRPARCRRGRRRHRHRAARQGAGTGTFPFYRWHHALIVPYGHPCCRWRS